MHRGKFFCPMFRPVSIVTNWRPGKLESSAFHAADGEVRHAAAEMTMTVGLPPEIEGRTC
jgi:hypothetical protein